MRAGRWAAVALAVSLSAACSTTSTVADPVQPRPSAQGTSPRTADPAALVGSWHLDAPGERSDAVLIIGDRVDGAALLFRPCGVLDADWVANRQGMLLMRSYGGDQTCFLPASRYHHPEPAWMTRITSFRSDGSAELLLDHTGAVVARLTPGAHAKVGSNRLPAYSSTPVVTAQMRAFWRDPAPLPSGIRAASPADVLGNWVPVGHHPSRAFVSFEPGNIFTGSDGCNGAGGQYLVGSGGVVLTTTGGSTQVGCENSPLPSWVTAAGRLGLRNGRLVFVSPNGKVLGEAARAA